MQVVSEDGSGIVVNPVIPHGGGLRNLAVHAACLLHGMVWSGFQLLNRSLKVICGERDRSKLAHSRTREREGMGKVLAYHGV